MATNLNEIRDTVRCNLPDALEGFEIFTSKSLVEKYSELEKFLLECMCEDFLDVSEAIKKEIIIEICDDWEFS